MARVNPVIPLLLLKSSKKFAGSACFMPVKPFISFNPKGISIIESMMIRKDWMKSV